MRTLEQQIRSADFPISRKGYTPSAVDDALETFADEVAFLFAKLRKEAIRVSSLERSLTFAQGGSSAGHPDMASLILEASDTRDKLLREASAEAAKIIEDAQKRANHAVDDAEVAFQTPRPDGRDDEIVKALEEARAIEAAARGFAAKIRADAKSDAARVMDAARETASRIEAIDTGTGTDGVRLAQQYR